MRVGGVDPSSTSAGFAVVENGKVLFTDVWVPSSKHLSSHQKLYEYSEYLKLLLKAWQLDMLVIELVAVSRNIGTVRLLARYEGAAILAAKELNIMVKEHRVMQARAIVFGHGDISKRDAYKQIVSDHPYHSFRKPTKGQGGEDETDAVAMALAGPGLVEK
jgi:Holliday junction resolvasome RuvABC endonuclease subunit